MENDKTFSKGDKVRDNFGRLLTVVCQVGTMVYVAERCDWYHPTKLHLVK